MFCGDFGCLRGKYGPLLDLLEMRTLEVNDLARARARITTSLFASAPNPRGVEERVAHRREGSVEGHAVVRALRAEVAGLRQIIDTLTKEQET